MGDYIRFQPFQLFQIGVGLEQEHATVPIIPATRQKPCCRCKVRLLDEFGDRKTSGTALYRSASVDIAITGLRTAGFNPECHQGAVYRCFGGGCNCALEGKRVGDRMVGGQQKN